VTRVLTPIDVEYVDGRRWTLLTSFACETDALGRIDIPAGFVTDFASIPRVLWAILPPERHAVASLPHDWLYQHGALHGQAITRGQADALFDELLRFDQAGAWERRALVAGVRLGGWHAWNQYRKADHAEVAG
jgi:hypothetical protein